MSERFYVSFPLSMGEVDLEGAEAHHLRDVSRHRQGDRVILFNGDGSEYSAVIQTLSKKHVTLLVDKCFQPEGELFFHLEVAAPLPKGDRAVFLVEKLTELGVSTFIPLQTSLSVVQPKDTKLAKLERHVIEASKQCGRNRLMTIKNLTPWIAFAGRADLPATRWIAYQGGVPVHESRARRRELALAADGDRALHDIIVAIGPEGGWTDEEVGSARRHGWTAIDLGPRILRIETAAITLASLVALA
jgi:16S rRNA (uracil1498-N3)-methyltransferase